MRRKKHPVNGFPPKKYILLYHLLPAVARYSCFFGFFLHILYRKGRIAAMKKRYRIKMAAALVLAAGVVAAAGFGFEKSIGKAVEAEMNNICERTVSSAAALAAAKTPALSNVPEVIKNEDGRISMVSVPGAVLNEFSAAMSECVEEGIKSYSAEPVGIPLGSVVMAGMLAGKGPEIPVYMYPVSACRVSYSSEFSSTGINQSLFTLYVSVDIDMAARAGLFSRTVETSHKAAVCSVIIVGDVPDTYANMPSNSDFLNLLP